MKEDFLPILKEDIKNRGWGGLDIILITGDAYVDHPSYGAAVIGRVLEAAGFKVGIIAQPDWKGLDDFTKLGRPRLFFGITAGNLDSMVANYTANKRSRKKDEYSPGGKAGLRPDRATIVYSNKAREAFPGVPIVLGGIEASLRRLAHYDYWDNDVRRSILLDSRADILVYGMAERQILEIAKCLDSAKDPKKLDNIRGTVIVRNNMDFLKDYAVIPSFEEVKADKDKFNQAFKEFYFELDPFRGKTIVQKHQDRFVIQFPPATPLSAEELDKIYLLNYARDWHPVYNERGGVPGFETVRFSIIAHRGCCGECNFCSLYFHQGRIVQSRSEESILKEIAILTGKKGFGGTITDIGGPTANLYGARCSLWAKAGACRDKKCLMPSKCKNLTLGYAQTLRLWEKARKAPKVKHVFIGSGLRHDLLIDGYSDEYLATLCKYHVSGQLKVAPEHVLDSVLKLMNKASFKTYESFERRFTKVNKMLNKRQYLVNYFISGHPGAGLDEAYELALYLFKRHMHPEQIQDFIPLPLTVSGCMYYTERDPFSGRKVCASKTFRERKMQRALLQYRNPRSKGLIHEALRKIGKNNPRFL
jgi:uncharacterized radical SAM protein YgiQ